MSSNPDGANVMITIRGVGMYLATFQQKWATFLKRHDD
jgi:hypothetical protein